MRRSLDKRWSELFANPGMWWDNRSKNVCDKWTNAPDFRHSVSGEALWISSCPSWLSPKLQTLLLPLGNKGIRARLNTTQLSPPEFVAALKQCTTSRDLSRGRTLHSQAIDAGFHTDTFVASALITMYSKCAELSPARQVLEDCTSRDAVVWNSLILGCVENGESATVMDLFRRMTQLDHLQPTRVTFLALLKSCSALASEAKDTAEKELHLNTGIRLHDELRDAGLASDLSLSNTLIDLYSKCGSMERAKEVFDGMIRRDVVSWTCLILGYVEEGEFLLALEHFTAMDAQPDSFTHVAALRACAGLSAAKEGQEALDRGVLIHREIKQRGYESHLLVASTLVDMYCKHGEMKRAKEVFDRVEHKDLVTWSCLMRGYVEKGEYSTALELFMVMDCDPDSYMCVAALKACAGMCAASGSPWERESNLDRGVRIHRRVRELGLEAELVVGNALVDMYGKLGEMESARRVFDGMPHRDAVSWNSLMLGYVENRECRQALELFHVMECQPTRVSFIAALKACGGLEGETPHSRLQMAESLHRRLRDDDLDCPGVATTLVYVYGRCGNMKAARETFDRLSSGCRDAVAWTCLVVAYVENGEYARALEVFDEMTCDKDCRTYAAALKACAGLGAGEQSVKEVGLSRGMEIHEQARERGLDTHTDVVNSLIDMYGRCGSMQAAVELFDRMHGRRADSFTYVSAIKACQEEGGLTLGQYVHACVCRLGVEAEQVVANVLVGLHAKCGCIGAAVHLFSGMASPGVVSWNALISGYSSLADSVRVFSLVEEMHESRVEMNGITFVCVLNLCSHAGMVEQGRKYFELMKERGIKPGLEHYTCMVDMLGRANKLEEALSLIRAMPFQTDEVVWTSLLGACRKWNNLEVAKVAFDALVARGSKQAAAPYVLLGDIYRGLNMQEDGDEVERKRKLERAWKKPGVSWWCDSLGRRLKFTVGGETKDAVKEKLESVLRGYKPDETYNKDDLCGHSEKLAIAHALCHTEPGEPIRIVNNMRLCNDCHHATSYISKVESRRIICRDTSRIHIFENGSCTCGDYW